MQPCIHLHATVKFTFLSKGVEAIERGRMKVAVRRQIAVMKKLGEKFMSDEETDDDDNSVLIKRSLPWRSSALNKPILKLDCACLKKKLV